MFEFLQNIWFYFALLLSVPPGWFIFLFQQAFVLAVAFGAQYGWAVFDYLLVYTFDDRLLGWSFEQMDWEPN